MATGTNICRVCGKEYPCCGGTRPNIDGVFRYKDVACSPQCGAKYLAEVNKSRGIDKEIVVINGEVVEREKQAEEVIKTTTNKSKKIEGRGPKAPVTSFFDIDAESI